MPQPAKKKTAQPESDAVPVSTDETAPVEAIDAAADEAATADLVIPWRGIKLSVSREVLTSARFLLALRSGQDHTILAEILGPENNDTFMATLRRGEQMPPVAAEFLGAVSAAAGWGNSEPS